jgi:molybdopterin converting factor small subunit
MENAALHSQMKGKEKCITMEQYKAYRVKSVASMPCTLMMEYLYNITLTDAEYHHPKLQQLEKTGTLQIALINDLFSLFKEYKGSTFENLNHVVSILVLNERKSVQEAINEVCDEIERLQDKFINIRDEWYASEVSISANVREFITGFEYYISGNARWHRLSKRYHGENFEAIITSGTMEWSPEGTLYTPD